MTKWQALGWVAVAYVLIVAAYLALAAFLERGQADTEDSDDHEASLSLARARERDAVECGARPAPVVSALSSTQSGAVRDDTIGRDQYRTEARNRIRDLQPLTLRQREAIARLRKGH